MPLRSVGISVLLFCEYAGGIQALRWTPFPSQRELEFSEVALWDQTLNRRDLRLSFYISGRSFLRFPLEYQLTIPELLVPDAFRPLAGAPSPGYVDSVFGDVWFCRYLAALVGGGTPTEGLTSNLTWKGHRLCRPLTASLRHRKHLLVLLL